MFMEEGKVITMYNPGGSQGISHATIDHFAKGYYFR